MLKIKFDANADNSLKIGVRPTEPLAALDERFQVRILKVVRWRARGVRFSRFPLTYQ